MLSYLLIRLPEATVKNGMNKELALEIATQAVLSGAQTLANSTENPGL